MADYNARIANCWIRGEKFTEANGHKRRNRVDLCLNGINIGLLRTPESFKERLHKMHGQFWYTTDIIIRDVRGNQGKIKKTVKSLTELLSFATMSQVEVIDEEFSCEISASGKSNKAPQLNLLGSWESRPVRGITNTYRPTFDPQMARQFREFIEMTWPTYCRIREGRKLHVVFDYLTTAERPDQPIEIKILLASVVLESLKSTFAKSKGIPYCQGWFRRPDNSRYYFEPLLKDMLKDVSMRKAVKRIVELRNEIIHFGLSRKPVQSLNKSYIRTQELIREYILRILDYRGEYRSYKNANKIKRI